MTQTVYIFGTDHKFQFQHPQIDDVSLQLFSEALNGYISKYGILGLAEECNEQALAEIEIDSSLVQTLAEKLSLPHRYCDPDRDTRDELGILQENYIRSLAFIHDANEDQVQEMINESYLKRESYWATNY